jgi:dCTP deaminase
MILSGQAIRILRPLNPLLERTTFAGMSYGLGPAGYDVRVEFDSKGEQEHLLMLPGSFCLASTIERFDMPKNLMGIVHDKSSWARKGLAIQNTVIEPGWSGYLTLELSNHGDYSLMIPRGVGIAQIIFHQVMNAEENYNGKYQDQPRGPQEAR